MEEFKDLGYLKSLSMEIEFCDVDPDLLHLMTGGVLHPEAQPSTVAVEVSTPVKRTFWQWLRRKPRQWCYLYFPNAKVEKDDDGTYSIVPVFNPGGKPR